MAGVESGYAEVDGLKLYYEVHSGPLGHAAPLVLLHGGMMAIETAFAADLLPRFARTGPVIAIEQQGHGHTGDRPGPASLERMVEDTSAVLRALGVTRAHLLGHSLGGMIALGMGIRHPEQTASLTPVSAVFRLEGMLDDLVKMQRGQVDEPSAALIPLLPTEADFAAWRAHYELTAPDPAAFDTVLTKLNVMFAQWPGWSQAEVASISAPTLVVIGDNDFTRIEHAAQMMRLIPGAQLAVLPGTTHMNIIERGDWLELLMQRHLAGSGG